MKLGQITVPYKLGLQGKTPPSIEEEKTSHSVRENYRTPTDPYTGVTLLV